MAKPETCSALFSIAFRLDELVMRKILLGLSSISLVELVYVILRYFELCLVPVAQAHHTNMTTGIY